MTSYNWRRPSLQKRHATIGAINEVDSLRLLQRKIFQCSYCWHLKHILKTREAIERINGRSIDYACLYKYVLTS